MSPPTPEMFPIYGHFLAKTAYTQFTRWAKNQKKQYYKIEHLQKIGTVP